jgi:integrase
VVSYTEAWLNTFLTKEPVSFNTQGKPRARETAIQYYMFPIYTALKTGARLSEILGLNQDSINNNTIRIDKTWDYKYTKDYAPTKNLSSVRTIVIDQDWLTLLAKFEQWRSIYDTIQPHAPYFVATDRNPVNSTVNETLRRVLTACGVPDHL